MKYVMAYEDRNMKEASDVCASGNRRRDFEVLEVATSSFKHAHYLLSCISSQTQKRSYQEVSLIAQSAVNEFRNLLNLLDGSIHSDCKRIRKGPVPRCHDINPNLLMDSPFSLPQNSAHNLTQRNIVIQNFPLKSIQPTAGSIPKSLFYVEKQKPETSNDVTGKLVMGLNLSSSSLKPSITHFGLDASGVNKQIMSLSSEIVGSRDDSSMFSKMSGEIKSKEEKRKCLSSNSGCHCSRRRKLRLKTTVRVPAPSSKSCDIPQDDHSWRKYGQKPIKGSPHPRSYYKCSSMRGCPARKHVERCMEDPTMFAVTYEGDHNHTTSLPPSNMLVQL
ncbi:hypothetical protein K2173_018217 [Erythroxylum novogranatense]|uniref:WRKY domain-containing protein n=1 Tax=Erythroxylum novogranatense TaxID=1862640 RepID=A0AAV8TNK5_9ROSI|nr:hypothetical protein K2173_018217 [Erythroxylum novogranatense]